MTFWRSSRFFPRTRTWSSWMAACTFSLRVLDEAHDLPRLLDGDALLEGDLLAQHAARGRLRLAVGERLEGMPRLWSFDWRMSTTAFSFMSSAAVTVRSVFSWWISFLLAFRS